MLFNCKSPARKSRDNLVESRSRSVAALGLSDGRGAPYF
jgi:hypothetical protein